MIKQEKKEEEEERKESKERKAIVHKGSLMS